MRTFILLMATLTGGIAGFFAGGYGYNAFHPPTPLAPIAAPRSTGDQLRSLQSAQAGVAAALDRHRTRQTWIAIGTGTGLVIGFLATVLAYRLSARDRRPRVEAP